MTKSVLVTGATGFIGRHVVKRLWTEGWQVHAVSRNGGFIEDLQVESLDLADEILFQAWHCGKVFDAIIHLAADIPEQLVGLVAEKSFRQNVSAMLSLLRLAEGLECPLIYMSSSSVYGMSTSTSLPISECTCPAPNNFYSTSKAVGDLLCEQISSCTGIPCTTLRISAPYGPGSFRRTVVNIFLESALTSTNLNLYGNGARMQDFTYIDDIVEAVWLALHARVPGIFNVASGNPISMRELAEKVLLAIPESNSQIVYSGQPDSQEDYRPIFSIEKAHNQLGWSPQVDLISGLRLTAEAMQQRGIFS